MVEKKTLDNPLPEGVETPETKMVKPADTQVTPVDIPITPPIPADTLSKPADSSLKPAAIPPKPVETQMKPVEIPVKPAPPPSPRLTVAGFMKMEPNDPYRRLLPAVLFVLTFVTVMSMLLIYMDSVAENAQQFRLNMSHDYDLSRIPQASAPLVSYVRELHLAPRRAAPAAPAPAPRPTPSTEVIDKLLGESYVGTFVELVPTGAQSRSTRRLEARGWRGLLARAAARDFLALRSPARALHAGLSSTAHPREVAYQELENQEPVFRSRVLCLPIYTVLLAADATRAEYLLLGGDAAYPALTHVPYEDVHLKIIEVISSDPSYRNKTTNFLATKNYTVAASFPHSIMYVLN